MATEIRMPKLSDNMEEGTILRWLKSPGDSVRQGEPLAEVETDKADVELEASESGVLQELRVQEGQSAEVGQVIAVLGRKGESAARPDGDDRPPRASAPEEAARGAARSGDGKDAARGTGPAGAAELRGRSAPAAERPSGRAPAVGGHVRASPLALRLAAEHGVDVHGVRGSGPGGRIVKRDVEAVLGAEEAGPREASVEGESTRARSQPVEPAGPRRVATPGKVEEPSRMRRTIAHRMTEAKQQIPHFYVRVEIDMSEAVRLRHSIRETGRMPRLTVTHLLAKAAALTLEEHPRVNASWESERIVFHEDINLGIAVAIEDGLVVPVLHRVQGLSLAEISERAAELTERARKGKFAGDELTGGTFSISNVGTLDVDELVAVINPPQAAILAVGAVRERAIVRDGELRVASTIRATLSCDHRVLNGVEGGRFLTDLKQVLESPVILLLD